MKAKMDVEKITIAIDEILLKQVDRLISEGRFPNREQVIHEAVREMLEREKSDRLVRELAKPDPVFEQTLADRYPRVLPEWPRD